MHKFDLYPAICPACASVAADEILTKNLNSIFVQKFAETSKSWLSIWTNWNWVDHYFGFWDLNGCSNFRYLSANQNSPCSLTLVVYSYHRSEIKIFDKKYKNS